MLRAVVTISSAIYFSSSIAAFAAPNAAECQAKPVSTERLACFDTVFPPTFKEEGMSLDAPIADKAEKTTQDIADIPAVVTSSWDVVEEKSPLDDSKTIYGMLTATSVQRTGIGTGTAVLLMRCRENTTSLVLSTDMFMLSETPSVTFRKNEEPAVKAVWGRSSDYKAVGLWSGSDAIPFIKSLKNNDKLFFRLEDKDRLDAIFNLSDVETLAAKIGQACAWSK